MFIKHVHGIIQWILTLDSIISELTDGVFFHCGGVNSRLFVQCRTVFTT